MTNAYIANCLNQYTAIGAGTVTPTYDADGNMTFDGRFRFSWDAENRMVGASNATEAVCNAYDHQSRRIRKSAGNETRIIIYDGWNIAAEITVDCNAGTTNVTRYVWGLPLPSLIDLSICVRRRNRAI